MHEAYIRLVESPQSWETRGHFFTVAANSMRLILVDSARARQAQKRGHGSQRVELESLTVDQDHDPDMILDLDGALTHLAEDDPKVAELVKHRLSAGLSVTESERWDSIDQRNHVVASGVG